ncbi:MAG: hypothetical protein JNK93_19200 [Planctomycetia bacterium]|nr:hypothetical protein [Planctomycetia bacterium]
MTVPPPNRRAIDFPRLAVIGSEMFGFAMVGLAIDFARGGFDGVPWATLILGPLGVLAAFVHLFRLIKR